MVDHKEICELIPHAGAMCLLDQVITCDDDSIVCNTSTHYDPENPLRTADGLSAVHGIEYAAQAMALHGTLTGHRSQAEGKPGYIASVRDVEMHVKWLHKIIAPMRVTTKRISGDANAAAYVFSATANDQLLVRGRITVAFSTSEARR